MVNNSDHPGPNQCRILNPQDILLTAHNQYPTMRPEDTRLGIAYTDFGKFKEL